MHTNLCLWIYNEQLAVFKMGITGSGLIKSY